jgi:hypothetical protein
MKIKGWKKIGAGEWKSVMNRYVTLNPYGYMGHVGYSVSLSNKRGTVQKKLNKIKMNKTRAMKFAVNWMKKHPSG